MGDDALFGLRHRWLIKSGWRPTLVHLPGLIINGLPDVPARTLRLVVDAARTFYFSRLTDVEASPKTRFDGAREAVFNRKALKQLAGSAHAYPRRQIIGWSDDTGWERNDVGFG